MHEPPACRGCGFAVSRLHTQAKFCVKIYLRVAQCLNEDYV